MTRVRHCLPIITAACLTSISPVQAENSAGVLREVRGTVLVNQHKNYVAGYSGMKLKLGALVLTPDGASAVVKQTDGCLTRLEPNSRFILREPSICQGGVATMERIGPSYTGAIGAGTTNDAPRVAADATSDKGPSIDDTANIALGGGAGAGTTNAAGATSDKGPSIDETANIALGGGAGAGTTNAAGATSLLGTIEVSLQQEGVDPPDPPPISVYR